MAGLDTQAEWAARRSVEQQHRLGRGVTQIPSGELEFAQFFELIDIADKNWQPLSSALGKKAETFALLKRFRRLRDPIAHSRELLPFEQDILSGIAGEIRNKVTIYLSSQDQSGDYYPRIEQITDQFGNVYNGTDPENPTWVNAQEKLQVGDTVDFTCVGLDPQGRELEWSLQQANVGTYTSTVQARGNTVTLRWTVEPEHVRIRPVSIITLRALATKYHRFSNHDQLVNWQFTSVVPPIEA
ncbi:hypothetical protein ACLTEW_24300 [Gordonia lacunae]|uniref:hypothetical protein n=1 Tax=Gordonia TaxID=2053 RepID=UPI00200A57B0|nr:hypothetical protein [Gordonia terrae]UPW11990.1 hypothetical protein M1C59_25890 [Gordonia terrae]